MYQNGLINVQNNALVSKTPLILIALGGGGVSPKQDYCTLLLSVVFPLIHVHMYICTHVDWKCVQYIHVIM